MDEEETVNLQWCIDSESGEDILVDISTLNVVGKKVDGVFVPLGGIQSPG